MLLIKDLLIRKGVIFNLNADQSNFLATKSMRVALGLYMSVKYVSE